MSTSTSPTRSDTEIFRSEAKFRAIFEQSAVGIVRVDAQGRFLEANGAFEQLVGRSTARLQTLSVADITNPEDYPQEVAEVRGMVKEGRRSCTFEKRFRRENGVEVWARVSVTSVRDDTGKPQYYLGMCEDITERKKIEAALKLEEQRRAALLQLSQMFSASKRELVSFALEESVKLTGSEYGYLAFTSEDESVLHMYAWSGKARADCRIPEPKLDYVVSETGLWGEAIRQRKPVMTNDYPAANPAKKGFPPGHVPLIRHLNIPVFDGSRIVAVAGVANKSEDYDESDVRQLSLMMDGMWRQIQRTEADLRLRESESRFRNIVKSSPMGMHLYAAEGGDRLVLQEANQAADQILGLDHQRLVGLDVEEAFPGLRGTGLKEIYLRLCREGGYWQTEQFDYRDHRLSGAFEVYAFQTSPDHLAVMFLEISSRLKAQADLHLLGFALQSAANAILITDRGGKTVFVNRAFSQLTGWSMEEAQGRNPRFLNSGEQPREFFAEMWETILAGRVWCGELCNRRKDGGFYMQEQTITPVRSPEGQITHFIAIQQDITQRKRMESELQISRERFQKIFHGSPVAIGICTLADSRFLDVNPSYLKMVGYERSEIIGETASSLGLWVTPEQRARLVEAIRQNGRVHNLEIQLRTKQGKIIDVLTSVEMMQLGLEPCLLFINIDITERKQLESRIRQAAKMESIGTLAGGVAHDFNNLLTVMQGRAELLLCNPQIPASARPGLQEIAGAVERGSRLTRQLLMFSRKTPIKLAPLDLTEALANLTKMLQRIIGEDIALEVNYAPGLPPVLADLGLLEQVVVNLASNARDAMPDGGRLTLSTQVVRRADKSFPVAPQRVPGLFVCLKARDTGLGIPPEIQPHIFEPFFTTKEAGKGTGLGLATVHGIVEQHQGWIEFDTQPAHGTEFRVFLPVSSQPVASPNERSSLAKVRGGTETILLVEDEPVVRSLAQSVLALHGYRVLEAESGVAAMEVWEKRAAEIHLLLTDVIMPHGVDGLTLARQLRRQKPGLKVIFTSGYASPRGLHETLSDKEKRWFLQKPYSPADLARLVRQLLDEQDPF